MLFCRHNLNKNINLGFINVKKFLPITALLFASLSANANMSNVATEISEPIKSGLVIAVQPVDAKAAKLSKGTAAALGEELTNAIQRLLSKKGASMVERSKLEKIMMEQAEFQNTEEFGNLVGNAGADILVSPSVNRVSPTTIKFSARAVGVKGDIQGKVISASKTYNIEAPIKYAVVIGKVSAAGKNKPEYGAPLGDGLTSFSEINLSNGEVQNSDYVADAQISIDVSERETKESRQAKKDARGADQAAQLFGGFGNMMGGDKGKSNPLGGMIGNMMGSQAANAKEDAAALKKKVISIEVTASLTNTADNSVYSSSITKEVEIDGDSSKSQLKNAAKKAANSALSEAGTDLAAKLLGKPSQTSAAGGLLD